MNEKTGTAALLSIVAAIGSFFLSCSGNGVWGLLVAIAAVVLGVIGLIAAISPRTSGGLLSIASILLGVVGAVVAILATAGAIVT